LNVGFFGKLLNPAGYAKTGASGRAEGTAGSGATNLGRLITLCAGAPDTPEIAREMTEAVERARAHSPRQIVWVDEMLPKDPASPDCAHRHRREDADAHEDSLAQPTTRTTGLRGFTEDCEVARAPTEIDAMTSASQAISLRI
jgi:hypothetical protein